MIYSQPVLKKLVFSKILRVINITMMADDCDCGIVDRRAGLKNTFVFVISFFGMIYFMCYQRVCKDRDIGLSDCRYVYFGAESDFGGKDGVAVVWYTCFYAFLMVFSILGIFNVCCSKLGCTKVYAIAMLSIFFCITICDFITMCAVENVYKGSQNLREFYTFQVLLFWALQCAVICSAAYDSWYQGCGKNVPMIPVRDYTKDVIMVPTGTADGEY